MSPRSLTYYHHERKVQHPSIYLHLCPSTSCLVLMDLLFYNLKLTPLKYSSQTPAATSLFHIMNFSLQYHFHQQRHIIKFATIKKCLLGPTSLSKSLSSDFLYQTRVLLHCRHTFYHLRNGSPGGFHHAIKPS